MTAGAKIERIIALTEGYTQQLIKARKEWQHILTAASLLSTEEITIPPYPTDEEFELVAEAVLYRIRGVLDDSTV